MRSVPGLGWGTPLMQYPAEGAALLAPLCCNVQGPPVMWPCCGRLSAVHTFTFCAWTGKAQRTIIAIKKVKESICLFTCISLPAARSVVPRAIYDLPEDGKLFSPLHPLGEMLCKKFRNCTELPSVPVWVRQTGW